MSRGYVFCVLQLSRRCMGTSRKMFGRAGKILPLMFTSACRHLSRIKLCRYSTYTMPPLEWTNPNCFLKQSAGSWVPYEITPEKEELITGGDSKAKIKLQEVLLFIYLKKERGDTLPTRVSVNEFKELLCLDEKDRDYFLQCVYHRVENTKKHKKSKFLEKSGEHKPTLQDPHSFLKYTLTNNTLFSPETLSISHRSHHDCSNLATGLSHGQKVVFDCSFETHMNYRQLRRVASELNYAIKVNRTQRRPFGFYFCNLDMDGQLIQHLRRMNKSFGFDLPVYLDTSSYLDLFFRSDIVYLSPHVPHELEYDPADIYVIGAVNSDERLSSKKAAFDKVRCACLPLGFGQVVKQSSVLSIPDTLASILVKKNTGVWGHSRRLDKQLMHL